MKSENINHLLESNGITEQEYEKLPALLRSTIESPEVVDVLFAPNRTTTREIDFMLQTPIDLAPGQKIIIVIAQNKITGILKDVILSHRKKEKYWNLPPGGNRKDHDPAGAYSRIRVLDKKDGKWKDWKDPKGYNPIKFAERRPDIEYENLHDWYATVGNIAPLAIEITSAGHDPEWSIVTIHGLDVVTYPEISENSIVQEHIYTPGTSFADLKYGAKKLPSYGGGKHEGGYPSAVPLGGKNHREHFPLTESVQSSNDYIDKNNRLHIKLLAGKMLKSLEVSIGDTWFNYKGSGTFQLGWAKLTAYIQKKGGSCDKFINNANIPPQGVILGGPEKDYIAEEGDEVVIESYPTSYLMGWRLTLENGKKGQAIVKIQQENTNEKISGALKKPLLDLIPTGEKAGTQGGEWHIDKKTGDRYFGKEYHGNFDRCSTEYIVNTIYNLMNIPAVESFISGKKVFSREVLGSIFPAEKKYDKEYVQKHFNCSDILNGFVVDAWLANWDIFGLDYDNIIKTADNRMVRSDAGGCMYYRAMGAYKESFGKKDKFGNIPVAEIETMRNPKMAREAGIIFQNISNIQIKKQIVSLVSTMTDTVVAEIVKNSGISNSKEIIDVLIKRRNWLENYAKTL